ncbi:hypothetical protein [Flavobacterium sp.]|uniref:hypothetical protein n=1 Tax=Flavobacterium sp. TaxID=239 RepID=UPI0025B803A5|nr:hypothetical protein [Flavobacterium sp.]MBA4155562.1 hypothetical protein [Flavobacterium sp.]
MPLLFYGIIGLVIFLFFSGRKKEVDLGDLITVNPDGSTVQFGMPSINMAKAKGIASRLWDEMGSTFITSESKVMAELAGLNEADYVLIFKAFGMKSYDTVFSGSGTFWGDDYNLTQWLVHEITSTSNIKTLKTNFPNFF